MATITVNTFLDDGTARTSGETWTMNGGILTIRTDTRWHVGSPAAMTGTLGAMTVSATLGGGVLVDSRSVRWMPYNTGAGVVPAIGTTITQGGVSGYLLGVWASYTAAPSAVGGAMPASGYLKFREVTGGAFVVGALAGISANATAADRQGWIEVVQRTTLANTIPRLGSFVTRGGWFELDQVTSGAPNDIIQVPTNGGGASTHVPAVWIETGVGTGVYECYPALAVGYLAANLSTDIRSKFVQSIGSGQVRIGFDGTSNAGFVPPAGCRIRIPSNIGRQAISGTDAVNGVPHVTLTSRPDFVTTAAGVIDFEYFINDWYHLFVNAYSVRIRQCATFDSHSLQNAASAMDLYDYHIGNYNGTSIAFILANCFLGGTIEKCKFYRRFAVANGHACTLTTCNDLIFNECEFGVTDYARSTGRTILGVQLINCEFNDCSQTNGYLQFSASLDLRMYDFDHTDRFVGVTNATTGLYAVTVVTGSSNILVDGLTFGKGGAISGVNPYLAPFYVAGSSNVVYRNAGTRAAPLSVQAGFAPQYIFQDANANNNIKVQRCYLQATRTGLYLGVNTSKGITLESLSGTNGSLLTISLDTLVKGVRATAPSTATSASTYGSHTFDMFISNTEGRIWWAMNEPTAFSNSFVTLTLAGSVGGFTSGNQVSMPTVGDQLIIESPYYILGHTGFINIAPTLTGTNTGNFSYEYDLDINDGAGFTGTYKTLNGANLSAETISPSDGVKLRLRVTCATAATTNALTYVRINTTSTAVAQDNLYPLDTSAQTYVLTGLAVGTEVVVFNSSNVELDREVIAGTTYTYNYTWDSDTGNTTNNYVLIWKDDKQPIKLTGLTFAAANQSTPISQVDDLVYDGAAVDNVTINYGSKLIIMDAASTVLDVQAVYSTWKDDILVGSNAQYDFAFSILGGDTISGATSVPFYAFLENGWKIRPDEADHTLAVTVGILVDAGGGDPFVDTVGAFTVRINYQQPVQAITVSTGGGGGATAADVWSYSTRALTSSGNSAVATAVVDNTKTLTVGKFLALK